MKTRSSGSGIFLMEILLALLIFALTSAVCLQVFVTAHRIAAESDSLNRAVVAAQNVAECFKASNGDLSETARLITGEDVKLKDVESFGVTYDDYSFEIKKLAGSGGLVEGEVSISDSSGKLIFSVPVTAMEVAP